MCLVLKFGHNFISWLYLDTCCQDDTARPHVARMTLQKLTDLGYVTLPHPPNSPGLSPSNDHFSSNILTLFLRQKAFHLRQKAFHLRQKAFHSKRRGGCLCQFNANPRGVMVKAMDCGIVVREFVLQSRYYVHFRANTLGKGMNPLILPAMG